MTEYLMESLLSSAAWFMAGMSVMYVWCHAERAPRRKDEK